jgi:hypothetical protein
VSVDREGILRRVRALQAKADSTTFPAEADALRAMAAKIMAARGLTADDLVDRQPEPLSTFVFVQGQPFLFNTTGANSCTFTIRFQPPTIFRANT